MFIKGLILRVALLSLAAQYGAANAQSMTKRPRFEDYSVPRIWTGKPASVNLVLPSERMFKTRLSQVCLATSFGPLWPRDLAHQSNKTG
jgi:hypothetical protein